MARCAVLIAVFCLLAPAAAAAAQHGNPMAGGRWFVDPDTAAAQAERDAAATGDSATAHALDAVARTPQAMWFIAADDPDSSGYVHAYFDRWHAGAPDSVPVLVLHGVPHQVCAGDNAPGHGDAAAYRGWIDGWARLIGDQRVVVVLEPDALASARCLSPPLRSERYALIAYAARTLSALPHTGVYIDIGAADWLQLTTAAKLLKAAGVRYARGFSLNVTHFDWTANELSYGTKLARRVGGKHFVVNTALNGRGPLVRRSGFHEWCNPPGRALGPLPTTRTGNRYADALFWLQNPGLSDGHCNGGPDVGTFWLRWALELSRDAVHAADFPVVRHRR